MRSRAWTHVCMFEAMIMSFLLVSECKNSPTAFGQHEEISVTQ